MTTPIRPKYSLVTIVLHWLIGVSFIAMIGLGFFMTEFANGSFKWQLYFWHKSFGFVFLIAVFFRVLWRLLSSEFKQKAKKDNTNKWADKWQQNAAASNHILLYLAMILMPVSGVVMSVFSGYGINVFDAFTIAGLEQANTQVAGLANRSHNIIAYIAVAAIALHILAALYHHFYLKDNTLRNILPNRK